jgi:3-deoxy-D-arabino-heptulosonate 7-phosphate (DAHP) synthase
MDVNQKYCQSYHYENNELTDMLLIYGPCYQNAAAASREYAERFSKRHQPVPRQFINLVQRRNRQDRSQNVRKL